MVKAPGVQVPLRDAEATRRRLMAEGTLRRDLGVLKLDGAVVFPVADGVEEFEFPARATRAQSYADLLPPQLQEDAPRAFDSLGDIVILKVPEPLWSHRAAVGEALLAFSSARAVFHDHGVDGDFRVRSLERIAGTGGSQTTVQEHGTTLRIDPAMAYYSPRLAAERARIAAMVVPGERVIDLFGGVAPQGIQLAKAGAEVVSVDLNPAAIDMANVNAAANHVTVECVLGDARQMPDRLAPADRVIMNLPHGAKDFLDVAAALTLPGGMVHHHEILADVDVAKRPKALVDEFGMLGREAQIKNTRHVRAYSAREGHYVFDVRLA